MGSHCVSFVARKGDSEKSRVQSPKGNQVNIPELELALFPFFPTSLIAPACGEAGRGN
jgi:hypothetical protein